MDWKYYEGRKVWVVLKNKRNYSGKIIDIDIEAKPIVFITMLDKFSKRIIFTATEIEVIQEERE